MMKLKGFLTIALVLARVAGTDAQQVANFDMSLRNGQITESVTGTSFTVSSQLPACTVAGLYGDALRFDGYSNYVRTSVPASTFSTETLTMNVVLAAETYPMMQVDVAETTPTYATVCGNLDEDAKRGFALQLSSQGDLRLQLYVDYGGGYLVTVDGTEKLPRGRWCMLTMTFDKQGNAVTLYLDGKNIGSKKSNRCSLLHSTADFMIGKAGQDVKSGPFLINTFCGAIDDIDIRNTVAVPDAFSAASTPCFNYPAERYQKPSLGEGQGWALWRPRFHGMPSGSWTNESHGMVYSGGRYHVFFQKNANGPYMSRLHWGHISSADLYDWTEEAIAIYPGESFDTKGCWSGCVYQRDGNTYILYTGVDNARARIVQARALDENLTNWGEKSVIIDGRPAGLSDDFRDPYYFEANGRQYVIVGTSKNGIGATTLHRYENGAWTNDGTLFFQGSTVGQHGTFWEMPNVTPMGNGKWLFTCTPLGTAVGVRTLCWVGTIASDGRFSPTGDMQYVEMGGISRDGYGLLSPTICQKDGKTLLLGIVPDKLPTQENFRMGWAHNFSLPREVTLAADGSLVQKPYSGLEGMRTEVAFAKDGALNGTESLSPVAGRQVELLGEFTVANAPCGFRFLKSGDRQASLSYDPATGLLALDYTTLSRLSTDDGTWSAPLPRKVGVGETLKLHVFLDGSIVDIFVGDTWAFSARIFPTDAEAVGAEAFSGAPATAKLRAWVLDAGRKGDGIRSMVTDHWSKGQLYDLQGRCLNAVPQRGAYIQGGRKYIK